MMLRSLPLERMYRDNASGILSDEQLESMARKLSDEMKAEIIRGIPLSRLGEAIDVARICLFLASDGAEMLTAQTLIVDGGFM